MSNYDKNTDIDEDIDVDAETNLDEVQDIDEAKQALKTETARKGIFKEKARKAEEQAKQWEQQVKDLTEKVDTFGKSTKKDLNSDIEQKVNNLELAEAKRQFGYDKGLSPKETDFVFGYATGIGKRPNEVLDDEAVKAAVDTLKSQRRVDEATPSSTTKSPSIKGEQWAEMSKDERKKNFSKVWE